MLSTVQQTSTTDMLQYNNKLQYKYYNITIRYNINVTI